MKQHPARQRHAGFTLLEVVIATGLLTIIVGMVFGIARTSLALGNAIVQTQNEEMAHQAFFDLLGRTFSSMPGNARFDLKVEDSGSQYLSDLTLQNVPLSFTWGGEERIAKAIQLSTVRRRSGFLDIVLRYYENEILDQAANPEVEEEPLPDSPSIFDNEPFAEIVLLEDVAYFEWRVLDGRSLEWFYDWEIPNQIPLQLELVMAIGAKGEEIRQVFWLPPKQHPGIHLRGVMQQGGARGGGQPGGQPGGGGDISVEVPNPPGRGAGGRPGTPNPNPPRGGGLPR
ncbi:MAG: PulJ/GspJ family protein [Luteolibacter sp.]